MKHSDIKEQLFAFYDGELGQAVNKEIEAHLTICQECRELYQNWAKTAKVFFQAPKPAPSEFFVRRVMDQVHALEISTPKVKWKLSLPWLVPAIGLVLIFLAVMPTMPQTVSIDTLLFQDSSGHSSAAWMFSNKVMTPDETLQFVMEV